MPVPVRSGSFAANDPEARWYKSQDTETPTGRRRFNSLSYAAPPPGGPGSSAAENAFFEAARSPPRRRRGPATALRVSGLLSEAYRLNGDYVLQETGRFRQQNGDGLLVHRNGRWRLSYISREGECIASSGPLLGQWSNELGAGDMLQGPYPYIVATETRDEVQPQPQPQQRVQPPQPPRQYPQPQLQPPMQHPPTAPTPTRQPSSLSPPAPTSAHDQHHTEQPYQRGASELSIPARNDTWNEVAMLQARLDEADKKNSELAKLYEAQREECRAGQGLVDALMRDKESLIERLNTDRMEMEHEISCVRAEVDAEMMNHRKTAAGADIAISDYRKMVLEVEEDLFHSRQNEGRITIIYEEAEEFAEILIWYQAPMIGLHEANTMALKSERLAHEQTAAELAQQMQRTQELEHEKGALIAELEAERSAQEKTALGAEHLARELEAWRNDVKDTMLSEEIQTQARLARAQEAEEQAAKIISLLKEEVAELKMQLSGAEAKAAAEETDKTRLLQELRDHLEDAQRSSATEAKVREELLLELQDARRKAHASDILRDENFAGRLELLAVTAKMPPRLGGLSVDPLAYVARVDEVTNHLASVFQTDNDSKDELKKEISRLKEQLESKNALLAAQSTELQSKVVELDNRMAELRSKEAALCSAEEELAARRREVDERDDVLHRKESETAEAVRTSNELKSIVEELSGRINGMHDSARKSEELEAISVQQLKMLNEMSDNLNSAQQELAQAKRGTARQEELEEINSQLQNEVARLEKELRNAMVEEGVVSDLAKRVQEFELQADVSEGLAEAEARIRALEQSSKDEKEAMQAKIKDLEEQLRQEKEKQYRQEQQRSDREPTFRQDREPTFRQEAERPIQRDPASTFFSTVKEPSLSYGPRNLSPHRTRPNVTIASTNNPTQPAQASDSIWATPKPRPYPYNNTHTAQSMHDWLNAYKRY